jgi:hypothetical protein
MKYLTEKISSIAYEFLVDKTPLQSIKITNKITYLYFILIVIAYSLYQLSFNPWSTSGEMWAEMATNYYKYSIENPGIANLLMPDHGYIPLSQRILVYIISLFNFSSSVTAYLYTWSGIVTSALLVGSFSLHYFRALIPSDFSRILICIIILFALDWETSNFINFSYLNIFFISIFTALALKDKAPDAPLIAFFIPVLIVSKVYVLSLLPVLALAILHSKPRYRLIFITALFFSLLHMLYITHSFITQDNFSQGSGFPIHEKILSSMYFFVMYLIRDLIGFSNFTYIQTNYGNTWIALTGFIFTAFLFLTLKVHKLRTSPFILIGITAAFGTAFLNSFVNSPSFNIQNPIINFTMYRHVITSFIGFIFIYIGLLITWSQNWPYLLKRYFILLGLSIWIIIGGWTTELENNLKPGFLVSKWQQNSHLIDNAYITKPCVPLDPYPWAYNYGPAKIEKRIHCDYFSKLTFGVGRYKVFGENNVIDIPISNLKQGHSVKSLMSAVKSYDNSNYVLTMEVSILMKDGKKHNIFGQGEVHSADSMLFLTSKENIFIPVNMIKRMTLRFNLPAIVWSDDQGIPIFSWMGIKS